jgi:hypothetical protein
MNRLVETRTDLSMSVAEGVERKEPAIPRRQPPDSKQKVQPRFDLDRTLETYCRESLRFEILERSPLTSAKLGQEEVGHDLRQPGDSVAYSVELKQEAKERILCQIVGVHRGVPADGPGARARVAQQIFPAGLVLGSLHAIRDRFRAHQRQHSKSGRNLPIPGEDRATPPGSATVRNCQRTTLE